MLFVCYLLFVICYLFLLIFFNCLQFLVCSCDKFLISVDVLMGGIVLEGGYIICWVFVFRNESCRLGVRGVVDED